MAQNNKGGWQRWFWQPGTATAQKWLIGLLMLCLLGAVVPMLMVRGFVPAPHWQLRALYITLGLLALGGFWLRQLYRKGQWKPTGPWVDYGPVKRWLMLPLVVGFLGGILWINVAVTVPWGLNQAIGQEAQEFTTVQTKTSTGRNNCRHQFDVQGIDFMFFQFCIERADYHALPDTPMPAMLQLQRSYFGKQVYGLELGRTSDEAQLPGALEAQEAQDAFAE